MRIIHVVVLFFSLSLSAKEIMSAYAINTKTGDVVLDTHSDISLVPGSSLKVITTGAALQLLTPSATLQTTLEIDGEIKGGVLHGNLFIRGGGDPCLGSDRIASSLPWDKQIQVWANAIEQLEIKEIRGRIIADTSLWETAQAPSGWAWEDLGNYYGAGASALSFHENLYVITFKPGSKEGDPAPVLRTEPAVLHQICNEVKTGPEGSGDRACIYGSEYSVLQYVRGTVPLGVSEFSIKGAFPDPGLFCQALLSKALQDRGIQIQGHQMSGCARSVVHTTDSPKIEEIVFWANKKSVNLYAEHLLKKMGEVVYKEGSTTAGIEAAIQFWKGQGINLDGFRMTDGSGVSRKSFATAKQLVAVLVQMKKLPHFSIFYHSLPEEKPGVFAKTGTMSGIRSCIGYKGDVVFAIIFNNFTDFKQIRAEIGSLIDSL